MNCRILIAVVCLLGSQTSSRADEADDKALERILKDWETVRKVDDIYKFEYNFHWDLYGGKKSIGSSGEFTIHWKTQQYRLFKRSGSRLDSNKLIESETVFDGKMESRKVWTLTAEGKRGVEPPETNTVQGDFRTTMFIQEFYPFFLTKGVVITRKTDKFRNGQMYYEPDKTLLSVLKRDGDLVTINVAPRFPGPNNNHWQYVVDTGKKSSIIAMKLIEKWESKPDSIFTEYLMEYQKVGTDWVIAAWKKNDYNQREKPHNVAEVTITKLERLKDPPKFDHGIPKGTKVTRTTYPPYDPKSEERPKKEVIEFEVEKGKGSR